LIVNTHQAENFMKPTVFITRRIFDETLSRIRAVCEVDLWEDDLPPPYEAIAERVRGVAGLLCMITDRVDGALLDAAGGSLKVVSQMAVGVDNIDVAAAHARNIPVGHTPGVLTEATADLAMALLLTGARRIVETAEYIKRGGWQTWHPLGLLGADLSGATLGIVGFGRIGQAVAKRAAAFDLHILAYSRSLTDAEAAAHGVERASLEALLRRSDFVSLHTPLNPDSRHLINRDTLALMKPTALLINTARGGVVDQDALYGALAAGRLGGAALDVTTPEPLPADHPLLALPNVTIVPHIGSATVGTRRKMAEMAADNLIAGVAGQPLPHAVPKGR
jgi:lactate dehydrogenase-like 2-hydroxyacid dehydrogenase